MKKTQSKTGRKLGAFSKSLLFGVKAVFSLPLLFIIGFVWTFFAAIRLINFVCGKTK